MSYLPRLQSSHAFPDSPKPHYCQGIVHLRPTVCGRSCQGCDLFTFFQSRNHSDCIRKVPFNFGYDIIMPPDDTFLTLYLSVELLAKIPHFIAVCLGGMFCLFFQSLDLFPTLVEFVFKPLGLTPCESVVEIAEGILAIGILLEFGIGGVLHCRLFLCSCSSRFLSTK